MNILTINGLVASARKKAHDEARKSHGGFLQSRGAWYIVGRSGGRDNKVGNGEFAFDKRLSTLEKLVAECQADPEVDGIWIEGGYDAASTIGGFRDGDYDPYVSEWCVQVWARDGAALAEPVAQTNQHAG